MAKRIMGPENDVFYDMRGDPAGGRPVRSSAGKGRAAVGGPAASVFGFLALLCFIGVFITAFFLQDFLSDRGLTAVLPCGFGLLFFFAGAMAACTRHGRLLGCLFMTAGAAVAGLSAVYLAGSDDLRGFLMERVVPMAGLSVFVFAGAGFLIVPPMLSKHRSSVYTLAVRATVCGKNEREYRDSENRRHRSWYLDWRYYAGGKQRVYHSITGRSPEKREIGDEGVLYLNPEDLDDVWEKPMMTEKTLFAVIGAMFLAAGLVSMAMFAMSW